MTKLFELLTDSEKEKLSATFYKSLVETDIEVEKMTVEQLSSIAFILIETEYKDKCPNCVLSAEAINILTKRAIQIKN